MGKLYERAILEKFRSKVLIIYRTEYEEHSYTFGDVLKEVTRILQQFDYYNITPNTGIALRLQGHSPFGIALILSILNYNCYFIPLHFKNINKYFENILNAHGAKYVIMDIKCDNENCKQIGILNIMDNKIYLFQNISMDRKIYGEVNDLCYSISTSGTTGLPKIVQVPYSCVEPNILSLCTRLKLSENDVIYLCAPPTFDPFVVDFFLALISGASLLICPADLRLNPKKKINILWPKHRGTQILKGTTILQATPSFFRLFGEDIIKEVILHEDNSLRCLILGGEDFPSRKEWDSWLPTIPLKKRIFNIYGTTEMSCWCTIHECDFHEQWERAPIGTVLDGQTTLRITDTNEKELFGSCEGELKIGSATRFCYIPSTDDMLRPKNNKMFYRNTGDLVFRDQYGRIFYLGRTDSIIKRMGVQLNLESLQQRIQNILGNNCKNVKCLWHEKTHKVVCFIQANSNVYGTELMHIRRLLIENLMEMERPDDIEFISSFPLNEHGKIDRHCLLQKITNKTYTILASCEEIFHRFITEVLGVNLIKQNAKTTDASIESKQDLDMSFIAAGGTSFHAIALVSRIGAILDQCDQNELLGMLVSSQHSLKSIKNFLASCQVSKAQNLSKTLSVNSNSYAKKRLKFIWRTSLNKCVDSAPSVIGSKWVCVGSHSHILTILDINLGSPVAVLELPDRIECKVEIVSNVNTSYLAVVGCYDHKLYAFNFTNGHIYWSIGLGGLIKAKPLTCAAGLVIATYGEEFNVVCISLKTNNYIWRKKIGTKGIYANPIAINSYTMIICTLDGSYCKIISNSGELVWLRKCESPIFSTPVIIGEDHSIILAEVSGNVHICNAENGELMQTFRAGSLIFSALTILKDMGSKGKVLFGSYDKYVYCLRYQNSVEKEQRNACKLDLLWKNQLESNIFASPLAVSLQDDEYVLCCSTSGLIAVLQVETGEMITKYKLSGEIFSTPCNLGNKIFIGCRDNFLYSFSIH
ncbi:PREDICTED: acyl-CoA synthetase family member 4 homolog isoform X1 [Bactrocera latifrons]|uniref:acyl-CoA synthetase family member 4 homolog isoform X1 n=2 Tax=Bactrocera latifrons TaxID=174628 RepID=UPI0008DDDF58|nr:PREDICTED: acyl-CoA synthetase family member 4 homolog isoform X1 [Bactrocera latifrons]